LPKCSTAYLPDPDTSCRNCWFTGITSELAVLMVVFVVPQRKKKTVQLALAVRLVEVKMGVKISPNVNSV
jgi:hypothetical protein